MNEITILITLASIHFIALMSPGPDFALVVQNATRHGRQTGLYIALGLSCGILLHSLLSLTGISYLVHQQPTLFAIIQLAGGSYLLYLGYGALKATWATIQSHDDDNQALNSKDLILTNKREAFSKGFATNILNPKALVFFYQLDVELSSCRYVSVGQRLCATYLVWSVAILVLTIGLDAFNQSTSEKAA